jgi:hypothetical protein
MASLSNAGGSRRVIDVLAEISLHLVEQQLDAQIATLTLVSGTTYEMTLDVPIEFYLYPGAAIVVGYQSPDEELATVSAVDFETGVVTINLVNSHAVGEAVFGATFPTQATTDPLYTQSEMLAYLAQAQNDFLTKVPLILNLFTPIALEIGIQDYALPATSIECERVALQARQHHLIAIQTIQRVSGVVTAILVGPVDWTPGLPITVSGVADASFDTAPGYTVEVAEVLNALGQWTVSWLQDAADSNSTGGVAGPLHLARLYEGSQMQIAALNPQWQQNTGSPKPTHWYEDRSGVYGWGVAPIPRSNYFVELLCSVRDTETLGMLDSFLLPDCFIPYVKMKVLADALSKGGEQRSPTMAAFYLGRYNFGLMLADRFLRNLVNVEQAVGQLAAGAGAGAGGGR